MRDMFLYRLVVVCMALMGCAAQEPRITSPPETIGVYTGQAALLKCSVSNLNNNLVTWTFLSHDYVIYDGSQILTHDRTRHSILNTEAGNVKNVYLQILNVEKLDQGFYKCAVAGTDQQIIVHLDVTDVSNMIWPQGPPLNMTDCCLVENVSQSCMPGCYPSQIDLNTFDAIAECGSVDNLRGLSKCFTAGSNHDNCCLNMKVDPVCLGFCHNDVPTTLSAEYQQKCFTANVINGVFTCFEMGFEYLPSEPTEVEAIAVHDGRSGSILVKWSEPKKNPQTVTGYMILYKPRNQTSFNSVQIKDPKSRSYRLDGDKFGIYSEMDYKIRVSALADHGVSYGSIEVDIYIPSSTKPAQIITDVDICCSKRGVGDVCKNLLCHPKIWSKFDTQLILGCYADLNNIFTCLVGERNHTNCCAAFDVTAECLPVCSGQPPPFTDALISCVSQMGIIEACVQQGYTSLPTPPTEVEIINIEATSATFHFVPSSSVVLYYVVQLRKGNENATFNYEMNITASDIVVYLNNLRPNTYYWMRIISVGQTAASLPSETIAFLTYPEGYDDPTLTPVTNLPHNMTDCCMKSGMPEVCWKGCEYRSNITSYYKDRLMTCFMHIGSVLTCAADGRDHTECCRSRGVRPECVDLCAYTQTGPLESKHVVCVPDTPQAITCFSEGIVNLPRHPDVVVSNVSKNSISLKWEQPKTSGLIDSYIIHYEVHGSFTTSLVVTNKTFYILQNLEPSTQYDIYITSENSNGTSAPSPVITQYTLSDDNKGPTYNATDVPGRALWQNVSHCCENSVAHECLDQCLNEQTVYPQTSSCITESHKMLACFADGKDHRMCCKRGGLSDPCLPICGGHALATDVTMATCMSYANRDIILRCFLEGKGLIPDAPGNFGLLVDSKGSVKLEWSPPVTCKGNCTYALHYWKVSQDSGVTTIDNITDTFTTVDVLPGSYYTFTVTAHNEHGSSSPSTWQTLFIDIYERNVNLYLDGDKKWVEQGQPAKLICARSGFNPDESYRIEWVFNNYRKLNNDGKMELLIPTVDSFRDQGEYTCTVVDSVVASSDTLFLPVKYSPKFKQFEEENANPSKGEITSLACLFQGLPDSDPQGWQKEGQPLKQDGRKYTATLNHNFETGITTYKLKIADIIEADYGLYSLTVSNAYGSAECHVDLTNPANITVNPPSGLPDLKKCCAAKDVSLLCQELCGFHVNVTEIVKDSHYSSCVPYFETYITCGADGRDHSTCCQSKGVLPHCVPLCSGVVPKELENLDKLLECVSEHTLIFSCAQQGHLLLPYAPEDVTLVYLKSDKSILVRWRAPHHSEDKVEHYNIFYNYSGSPVPRTVSVNGRVSQHYIRDVQPHAVYNVWMTAGNKNGYSLSTAMKTLDTASGTDQPMADEQKSNDVAVGVGVTLGVIAVVVIVFLVLFFMYRSRLLTPRVSKTVKFENPGYGNQGQIKIHGVDEPYSYGRLQEDRPPEVLNVHDSSSTGESAADSSFENPMYKIQQPSTSSTPATLPIDSHS